jgi:sugar lactone lactonase YvrE
VLNGALYQFDSVTGAATSVATGLTDPGHLAISADGGKLFVADLGVVSRYSINSDHSLTKDQAFATSFGDMASNGAFFGALAFGPDGFLYATTKVNNGSLDPNANGTFILRTDPVTGETSQFLTGSIATFLSGNSPNALLYVPVPEPSTPALLASGCAFVMLRRVTHRSRRAR